jgi:hypothetical protein
MRTGVELAVLDEKNPDTVVDGGHLSVRAALRS